MATLEQEQNEKNALSTILKLDCQFSKEFLNYSTVYSQVTLIISLTMHLINLRIRRKMP